MQHPEIWCFPLIRTPSVGASLRSSAGSASVRLPPPAARQSAWQPAGPRPEDGGKAIAGDDHPGDDRDAENDVLHGRREPHDHEHLRQQVRANAAIQVDVALARPPDERMRRRSPLRRSARAGTPSRTPGRCSSSRPRAAPRRRRRACPPPRRRGRRTSARAAPPSTRPSGSRRPPGTADRPCVANRRARATIVIAAPAQKTLLTPSGFAVAHDESPPGTFAAVRSRRRASTCCSRRGRSGRPRA